MSAPQSNQQTSESQVHPSFGTRLLDVAALLLALGFGCWFWLYFFGYGRFSLSFEDWPIHAYYFDITRSGLIHGQIPWISNWSAHGTDKFLAVPETLVGPQILLLPWLTNGMFVALDVCLLFSAGVWGWWEMKKALGWSREAFLLAVVATSFNGFVISHLAAGHLMWSGCFFAPWVLLGLLKILAPDAPRFSWLPLAFALFALFLVGAFHIAIWWIFFIGLASLARPKALVPAFFAVAGACAMALFRILPAKLFIGEQFAFLTGYPSLRVLLNSFTEIKGYTPGNPADGIITASLLGWWEFDHYTGWALLLFVILAAVVALVFWREKLPFAWPIAVASLGMAVLSYGMVYSWIYPLVFFHTERLSTRFITLSFTGFFLIALAGIESQPGARARLFSRLLCVAVLAFVLHDFWAAAQPWLLFKLEAATPFSYYFPELEKLTPALLVKAHQLGYRTAVLGSVGVSLLAFVSLSALFVSPRLRAKVRFSS